MSPHVFILTICAYLFSIVASLVISFFSRLISIKVVWTVISIHVVAGLVFLALRDDHSGSGLIFLSFFCTGILLAGLVLRRSFNMILKIYFLVFLLSIPVFIVSPSRLLGFISSGKIDTVNPKRFRLVENFYLVEQEIKSAGNSEKYKLVMEMGVFHKTITRDIMLPVNTDSVAVRTFEKNNFALLTAYYNSNLLTDSVDVSVSLILVRDSSKVITRKP